MAVLVFDGVTLLDVSGPSDAFRLADPGLEHYELILVSPDGGHVTTSSGLELGPTLRPDDAGRIGTDHIDTDHIDTGHIDTLLVAGGEKLTVGRPDPGLLAAVATLADGADRVASVCTGAFLLAELGLLDDRRVTTHWRHARTLARRYPRISVEPDVIHVRDGRYVTSAGITAGIDLALALIEEDLGPATAREVARELVVYLQRPGGQSQYSAALRGPTARNGELRRLMESVIADPGAEHTAESMAAEVGVSVRHLSRMFSAETGTTPAKWLEEVRLDAARNLLLDGHPVTRVAALSGFGSDETLRRAFARHLGTTPTAFRDRFTTTR